MYKKTADLVHLHERTGSHATKGRGRGTPWFDQITDEERDIIELRRAREIAHEQYRKVKAAKHRAKKANNKIVQRACNRILNKIKKDVKALKKMKCLTNGKYIDGLKFRW